MIGVVVAPDGVAIGDGILSGFASGSLPGLCVLLCEFGFGCCGIGW